MTDSQFDIFLEKSIKGYGNEYIDFPEDLYEPHVFSKGFEKKMSRIIKSERSFYFPAIKTPLRRLVTAAITIIVLMSVMTMSVSAFRDAFIGFIARIFDTHTEVQTIDDDNAPLSIEDIYAITVPEGFELVYADDDLSNRPCCSFSYIKNNEYIFFTQFVKSEYDVNVNTENNPTEYIEINGYNGYIIDLENDEYYISWDSGDYVFDITGNIGKDTLIDIAETVQKVE